MERIVVVGASAGGVSALEKLAAGLAPGFPAPVLVVLHLPVGHKSLMAGILARAGPLAACDAEDGMPLEAGTIYVAQSDHHLMVDESALQVRKGPRENGFRPSVDVLFRSAAYAWGSRAIGIVLSGALDDGASGLWAVKAMGGVAIVQEPGDAAYDSMPTHALRRTDVDHAVAATDMGPLLSGIVKTAPPPETAGAAELRAALKPELDFAAGASPFRMGIMNRRPTGYTCPECHGALYELREGSRRRFRCHTGHGYTAAALVPRLVESSESRVWDAVRSVEEAVVLLREAAEDLQASGLLAAAEQMRARANRAMRKLDLLRALAVDEGGLRGAAAPR